MHHFPVTIYYEDTDLGGHVYHANYLKFIERARSTMLIEMGISQRQMWEQGYVFVVRAINAEYLRPTYFEEVLDVRTTLGAMSNSKFTLIQSVFRGDQKVFEAEVHLVCITMQGRPVRIPAEIRAKLGETGQD